MEPLTAQQLQLIEDQTIGEGGLQPYIQEMIRDLLFTARWYMATYGSEEIVLRTGVTYQMISGGGPGGAGKSVPVVPGNNEHPNQSTVIP